MGMDWMRMDWFGMTRVMKDRFIAGFQDIEWEENKADQEDNEQCCYQEKAA